MGPISKAVPSFSDSLTEYVKGGGRHSEHFSLLKIVFTTLMVLAQSSIGKTIFDNVSTAKLP